MEVFSQMFREVLEIIPKLSVQDLKDMEKNLASRFANVAKKFGRGLTQVLTGGSILAAGAALVQRLLNPLKEIQEAVDRTLDKSSTLSTQANQFGTSSGELAKLHAFGAAKGIDEGSLNILIEKFQSAVTSATNNPGEHSAVRQFVGQKDMAQGFLDFIQNLQKLSATQQVQIQEEVFGGKQILKMSEFLHADFAALAERFKGVSVANLTKANEKLAALSDIDKANFAYRNLKDIQDKAKVVNSGVIQTRDEAEGQRLAKENERLADFRNLGLIDQKMEKIQLEIEKLTTEIFTKIPVLFSAMDTVVDLLRKSVEGWRMIFQALKGSRVFRLFGGGDKDK
jgi:hypothetical protein